MIPSSFECAGFTIKVEIVDSTKNNSYGQFCDATNTIKIAKTVEAEGEGTITLTEAQKLNTFYHELIHVFQFYYNNDFAESQAQVFANFICEYERTKQNV